MKFLSPGHLLLLQQLANPEKLKHVGLALIGGTAAAALPPFRPGKPALCVSHPLVTTYCRLGDLLCFVFIVRFRRLVYFSVIDVLYVSFQYFDTVGWVF